MTATSIQQSNLHMAAQSSAAVMERVIVAGDLAQLTPQERVAYYMRVCESVGLNPLTKPFEYIRLNGKLTLYALKTTTDQLRQINTVSIYKVETSMEGDVCICTAHARTADGREDMDIGAVNLKGLQGENLANARMKALTKAKRRVTLSICGLGWLDESEVDSVPSAQAVKVDASTGEIQQEVKPATPVTPPPQHRTAERNPAHVGRGTPAHRRTRLRCQIPELAHRTRTSRLAARRPEDGTGQSWQRRTSRAAPRAARNRAGRRDDDRRTA